MNIQIIKAAIESLRDKNQERYFLALQKDGYDELDKKPTVDSDGRLHAPCDNYTWIDGVIYLGGMYLPDPYLEKFDLLGQKSKAYTYKIKIAKYLEEMLSNFLPGTVGKSWIENDIEVCYFYALVTRSELKLLTDLIPNVTTKKIVLVSEFGNPDNQKTWKFSSKRIWRKFIDMNIDDIDFLAPGVDIRINEKGEAYS
ncbi:MAG: hypothetical protein PHC28_13430, partial [Flavobacterium sp.]|uniref:hypothetical protein n=1 Tax=Flavobacterium sp. TaxID=239 RepID=UPI002630D371